MHNLLISTKDKRQNPTGYKHGSDSLTVLDSVDTVYRRLGRECPEPPVPALAQLGQGDRDGLGRIAIKTETCSRLPVGYSVVRQWVKETLWKARCCLEGPEEIPSGPSTKRAPWPSRALYGVFQSSGNTFPPGGCEGKDVFTPKVIKAIGFLTPWMSHSTACTSFLIHRDRERSGRSFVPYFQILRLLRFVLPYWTPWTPLLWPCCSGYALEGMCPGLQRQRRSGTSPAHPRRLVPCP